MIPTLYEKGVENPINYLQKKATESDESQFNRFLQQTFETYVETQQTTHTKQQMIFELKFRICITKLNILLLNILNFIFISSDQQYFFF
jgi:hypothetical protein